MAVLILKLQNYCKFTVQTFLETSGFFFSVFEIIFLNWAAAATAIIDDLSVH
jgi:hypothetical protein